MTTFGRLILCAFFAFSFTQVGFADQEKIRSYSSARNILWKQIYPKGGSSLYCQDYAQRGGAHNVEHVFAASWMKGPAKCGSKSRSQCRKTNQRFNHMEADLHNLFPARTIVNSQRSNFAFAIIEGSATGSCDFEFDSKARLAEPSPEARGQIARALLYYLDEYDIDWRRTPIEDIDMIKYWHCTSPVTREEKQRNRLVESIQGTSNPYIDQTEMIDCDELPMFPVD